MRQLKSHLDLLPFIEWTNDLKFELDGTGILMANGQWRGVPDWNLIQVAWDDLRLLLPEPRDLVHVMVNQVPPGVGSGWHVDPEPGRRFERWHLPLSTNDGCILQQEGDEPVHMPAGMWCGPVKYWERHRALNGGTTERVHLILDLA